MGAAWSIPLRSAETQRHGRSGHFFRETARRCSRHTGRAALLSMAAWFALGTPKRLLWALHGAFRCSVPRSAETQRHGRSGHFFRQTARLCSRHTGRASLLSMAGWFAMGTPKRLLSALHGAFRCSVPRSAGTQRHGRSAHFFRQTARLCSRHTGRASLLSMAAWFAMGTPKRLLWALHGAFRCSVPRSAETQRHGRSAHFFRQTARLCSRHTGRASLLSMAGWFAMGTPKRLLWALHGAFRCSVPRSAGTQRHGRSGHFFRETARLCSRHTGRASLLSMAGRFAMGTPKRLLWALHGAFRCSVPRSAETQRHGRSAHFFRQTARRCSRHTGRASLLSMAAWVAMGTPKRLLWALHNAFRLLRAAECRNAAPR